MSIILNGTTLSGTVTTVKSGTKASLTATTDTVLNSVLVNISVTDDGSHTFDFTNSKAAQNSIVGGFGNDVIKSGSGNDVIYSGGGNDLISSGAGADQIILGTSSPAINAILSGNATVVGGDGNSTISVLIAGTDKITGGATADANYNLFSIGDASSSSNNPVITANITDLHGKDILGIVSSNSTVNATVSSAWIATAESINNGKANLTTSGNKVDVSNAGGSHGWSVTNSSNTPTTLIGGANDSLISGSGSDSLVATAGTETLTVNATTVVTVKAGATANIAIDGIAPNATWSNSGTINLTVSGNYDLSNLHVSGNVNIIPTANAAINGKGVTQNAGIFANGKTLTGTTANDKISTNGNNDSISGGDGADTLTSGGTNNTLTGGAGVDTFNVTGGSSTITDLGLGGADILKVSKGAIVTASLAAAWTPANTTTNAGTVNLNAKGFDLNLSKVSTGVWNITSSTDTGATFTPTSSINGSAPSFKLTHSGTGFDTVKGFYAKEVLDGGTSSGGIVLKLAATNSALNTASDAQLTHKITFDPTAAGISISLAKQTDSFTIGTKSSILMGDTFTKTAAATDTFVINNAGTDVTATKQLTINGLHIGSVGTGDVFQYVNHDTGADIALTVGHSTSTAVTFDSNGNATFVGSQPKTLSAALTAIATAFTQSGTISAAHAVDGEFALFHVVVNKVAKEYLYISHGNETAPSASDTLIQLVGVSTTAVHTTHLDSGHLTITA